MKWQGYPDATKEALWKVTSQTQHPEVLAAIKKCQEDYYALHPEARPSGQHLLSEMDVAAVSELVETRRSRAIAVNHSSQLWCGW